MQKLTVLKNISTAIVSTGDFNFDFCPNFSLIEMSFPNCEYELLPGIKWGNYCQLYTPAFWKFMYLMYGHSLDVSDHRIGSNVVEEIVACLLGGYGIPSEIGLAAFKRLRDNSLIIEGVSFNKIYTALSKPFDMDGTKVHYRFYNQKSNYIYRFLQRNDLNTIPLQNDICFRNWLLHIEGIGFKTASWITRNWLRSENVAILDIHILRAGRIAGFFSKADDVSKNYLDLEVRYINFCYSLGVRPSSMDTVIWNYMKKTNKLALQILSNL